MAFPRRISHGGTWQMLGRCVFEWQGVVLTYLQVKHPVRVLGRDALS